MGQRLLVTMTSGSVEPKSVRSAPEDMFDRRIEPVSFRDARNYLTCLVHDTRKYALPSVVVVSLIFHAQNL